MLLRLFSVSLGLVCFLEAHVLSYEELKDKPKGLAKDYYIHRLINEGDYTKEQIKNLSKDIFRKSGLVTKSINKVVPPISTPNPCAKINEKNILQASTSCQNSLTTIAFSKKLSSQTRENLAKKLEKTHPQKAKILLTLNTKNPAKEFAKNMQTAQFLAFFNSSSNAEKDKFFTENFGQNFFNALYNEKGFSQLLNNLIMGRNFNEFRKNFLNITPEITSQNDAFFLALNAVTLGEKSIAQKFFERAKASFDMAWQRDNATHWLYLLTNDDKFLNELAQSKDANMYSLYARDFIQNSQPIEVIVPKPTKKYVENFDLTDPFLWQEQAELAKTMSPEQAREHAKRFYANDSLGAYAYFMQKASGWEHQYFLMPQNSELEDLSVQRKSLIYALARQESLFIPAVISTSYALGTMQFMPFLANAIGKKELKIENFDQDDMFKQDIAYRFANHHLDYLEKFLYHPLFIAYAYNGGIGFTKRLITRDDMFKDAEYEPFLSIELVPVTETRNYGKKVLSNFVIYNSLMGTNIKISTLLESLTKPSLTDKFRN
ncbi:lytic transglycosylase domain-containing protein [Campylobacter sp. 9BO]|uniref:lytic transglycosylase domain-containing protein n=1 Tax=Campylobacter sp. 9BO TaxID=3424759 RepID=UPI003D3527A8